MKVEDIKFIKVRAGVRYWEDSEVNGERDVELLDVTEPTDPRMPLAVKNGKKGHNSKFDDYDWVITIDVSNGRILDWPQGTTANVFYKTCDDNTIYFIGENDEVLGEYETYVPDFLEIGDEGYGDYIILDIDENGFICHFKFDEDYMNDVINGAF